MNISCRKVIAAAGCLRPEPLRFGYQAPHNLLCPRLSSLLLLLLLYIVLMDSSTARKIEIKKIRMIDYLPLRDSLAAFLGRSDGLMPAMDRLLRGAWEPSSMSERLFVENSLVLSFFEWRISMDSDLCRTLDEELDEFPITCKAPIWSEIQRLSEVNEHVYVYAWVFFEKWNRQTQLVVKWRENTRREARKQFTLSRQPKPMMKHGCTAHSLFLPVVVTQ